MSIKRSGVLKLMLFMAVVTAMCWYVGWKRAEFLKGPVMQPVVSLPTEDSRETDFFVESRLERESARSLEIERLREILGSNTADARTKSEAHARYLALSRESAKETQIEQLVKARGYEDAVAFIGQSSLVLVVKADELTSADLARIGDLLSQAAGVRLDSVRVIVRR